MSLISSSIGASDRRSSFVVKEQTENPRLSHGTAMQEFIAE